MMITPAVIWVARSFFAAGVTYDLVTTQVALNRGFKEGNVLLGEKYVILKSLALSVFLPLVAELYLHFQPDNPTLPNGVFLIYLIVGVVRICLGIRNHLTIVRVRE